MSRPLNEAFARFYRPSTLDEVVGQENIIKILKKQIEMKEVKNAYLFCGPSGTGKTTIGRAFARAINNKDNTAIEIDAASSSGVENVRLLVSSAKERAIDCEYKIYILDEAHALSNSSWQAFLKCIEEPPKYTIFIFCTTDPQKIPATILNRVMRFNLTRISSELIEKNLMEVCKCENLLNYEETANYISKISNGQMRDALALLEKCASYSTDLNIDNTLKALGDYSYATFFNLINNIIDGNELNTIKIFNNVYSAGADLKLFIDKFLSFVIDVAKYVICKDIQFTKIPSSMQAELDNVINFNTASEYYSYIMNKLLELKNELKVDLLPQDTIQIYLLNMCRLK